MAWSVGSSGTAGVSSILVSLYRQTSLSLSLFFLVIVTCFAMSFALRSDAIARLILGFSLAFHAGGHSHVCADQSFCWMRDLVFSFLFACCRTRSFCWMGLLFRMPSLFPLRCSVFLLKAAVFADLALNLAVSGLCLGRVELSCVWHHFLGCLYLLCVAFDALLPHSLSSSPARDLQHWTWRLRCCLLEVWHRYVLDLAASHHRDHLCFSWHVRSRCSFLRDLDLFLKLRHVGVSSMSSFSIWDIFSCRTRVAHFSGASHCNFTLLRTIQKKKICNTFLKQYLFLHYLLDITFLTLFLLHFLIPSTFFTLSVLVHHIVLKFLFWEIVRIHLFTNKVIIMHHWLYTNIFQHSYFYITSFMFPVFFIIAVCKKKIDKHFFGKMFVTLRFLIHLFRQNLFYNLYVQNLRSKFTDYCTFPSHLLVSRVFQ